MNTNTDTTLIKCLWKTLSELSVVRRIAIQVETKLEFVISFKMTQSNPGKMNLISLFSFLSVFLCSKLYNPRQNLET